jgi:hypothetical protein
VEEISRQNQGNGDTIIKLKYNIAESNPKSFIDLSGIKNVARTLVGKIYERKGGKHGWTLTVVGEMLKVIYKRH